MKEKEQDIIRLCIEKLSEIYGNSTSLLGVENIGGGCINHAQKLKTTVGDFFLKWNASAPKDMFLKEATGLQEMSLPDNPFLTIPKVIWSKEADELPGLILLEFLQPSGDTSGFGERLGRGIACLHRHTADQFGFHHPNFCGTTIQDNTWTKSWPEFFAERRIRALIMQIRNRRGLSLEELKMYEKLVERMAGLLPHETVPSLVHGDLWSGNYMYAAQGPALIDPACSYSDREMELGMMLLFGGFSSATWNAYQEEWPLPGGWRERIRLYQLYHVLNHYLLFGGSYGWQAAEIARSYL